MDYALETAKYGGEVDQWERENTKKGITTDDMGMYPWDLMIWHELYIAMLTLKWEEGEEGKEEQPSSHGSAQVDQIGGLSEKLN